MSWDAYWDQYQARHDPQWRDEDYDDEGYLDQVDMEVDEIIWRKKHDEQ